MLFFLLSFGRHFIFATRATVRSVICCRFEKIWCELPGSYAVIWTLSIVRLCYVWSSGPFFVVSHKQFEHYRSPVYDRMKKGDLSLLMVLSQPVIVCGDVMVEFFNKPKMLAKVCFCIRSLYVRVVCCMFCRSLRNRCLRIYPLRVDIICKIGQTLRSIFPPGLSSDFRFLLSNSPSGIVMLFS